MYKDKLAEAALTIEKDPLEAVNELEVLKGKVLRKTISYPAITDKIDEVIEILRRETWQRLLFLHY